MPGGGGSADNAAAQNQADELRDTPGTSTRWDRQMWIRFAIAFVWLTVVVVAVLLAQ